MKKFITNLFACFYVKKKCILEGDCECSECIPFYGDIEKKKTLYKFPYNKSIEIFNPEDWK